MLILCSLHLHKHAARSRCCRSCKEPLRMADCACIYARVPIRFIVWRCYTYGCGCAITNGALNEWMGGAPWTSEMLAAVGIYVYMHAQVVVVVVALHAVDDWWQKPPKRAHTQRAPCPAVGGWVVLCVLPCSARGSVYNIQCTINLYAARHVCVASRKLRSKPNTPSFKHSFLQTLPPSLARSLQPAPAT